MIKEFLFNYFKDKGFEVNENDDLFKKGYIDSLEIFRLLLELEVNFGKSISIEELEKLESISIKEIVKLMERK